jgi:AraC-like DNA-binding protein
MRPFRYPTRPHGWPDHEARPVDRIIFATADVRIGAFCCPPDHPDFRTAGTIEGYTVVFPRTAVWIEHADRRPFVADPSVATIYNFGQPYTRRMLSLEGDRGDWFSLSRELAAGVVSGIDPDAPTDDARLFPVPYSRVSAPLYFRQRRLFTRIVRGEVSDPFRIEQEVVALVGALLELAIGPDRRRPPPPTTAEQADLVQRTREELARDPAARPTVRELAARVGTSPFHLCRLFRRHTGLTLHHYLLELRARSVLERLEGGTASLSRTALEFGFSSHSHFTAEFRRRFGVAPSAVRRSVAPRSAAIAAGA